MIQIRHVPEKVHRQLKARAALSGLTLSDYLKREITKLAEHPSPESLRERLAQRSAVATSRSPAEILHEERAR